ncbi:MAG: hypothetical protein ACPGLV_08510 [Bacteroidia bacterium]
MSKYPLYLLALVIAAFISSCQNDEPGIEEKIVNTVPEFFNEGLESKYGAIAPKVKVVANESASLEAPRDLAFHSFEDRKRELWVLSPGTDNTGAHTTTFYDPITDSTNFEYRRDGNAWHFMALATALDFGENGNWATAQGILDANRMGIYFTGPTLWSSDLNIYARVGENPTPQVNGSHLDMIHQSPMGMGIAHEIDNIYWVFDGFNQTICKYDFVEPHYPGGPDHSDGKVWRYTEPRIKMASNANIPSHMVFDKATGWLYIADTGYERVIKLNTKSGSEKEGYPTIANRNSEPLALYQEMVGAEYEVVADSGLVLPSGIALNENRLFVSDYKTGNIYCYDKLSHQLLGKIETNGEGVAGIEIGPEGNLWFVNAKTNELCRLEPQAQDAI